MTEARSQEIGPIVAIAMIAIGLSAVVWAVATKERTAVEKPRFSLTTGSGNPALGPAEQEAGTEAEEDEGITDGEWEKVLIDVEKVKTEGLVEDIDVSSQVVRVAKEKWDALEASRREEVGRHLAVYVGRVSGSDRHEVEIRDGEESLGTYRRD